MPKLPSVSDSVAGKSAARAQIESIRKQLKNSELRFTSNQWQDGLRSIEGHVKTFIGLIEEFAKQAWLETAHAKRKPIPPPRYRPAVYAAAG